MTQRNLNTFTEGYLRWLLKDTSVFRREFKRRGILHVYEHFLLDFNAIKEFMPESTLDQLSREIQLLKLIDLQKNIRKTSYLGFWEIISFFQILLNHQYHFRNLIIEIIG